MNRTPPTEVRRFLRSEVNFGCPVGDCGVPYLTYHHFDPTWETNPHHNPTGMIALCHSHHDLADGGRWTVDQLRGMKQKPFVGLEEISGRYDYRRRDPVSWVGNLGYHSPTTLAVRGQTVIGFSENEFGFKRLNLFVPDQNGTPLLVMEDDDWIAVTANLYDLDCPAQGKELRIVSKDRETSVRLRFDDFPVEDFRTKLRSVGYPSATLDSLIDSMGRPPIIPVWSVRGRLRWGSMVLELGDSTVTQFVGGQKILTSGFGLAVKCGGVISFG
jgi:hypothetical protein